MNSSTLTTDRINTWNISTSLSENGLDSPSILNTSNSYSEIGITDPNGISQAVAAVLNGLLIAVGTVGNIHALIIYVPKYKIQTLTNKKVHPFVVFVLSLAIIDLFTCVFVLALDTVNHSEQFTIMPENLCKVYRALLLYVHSNSILHVVLISIYCWGKFCFQKQIDGRLAQKLCLGCYVLALLPAIITALLSGYGTIVVNGVRGIGCLVKETYEGTIWIKLSMGFMVSLFAICFAIICVSYVALIRHLWLNRHRSKTASKKGGKTTATLIILTLIFVFSYIPCMALSLIVAFDKDYKNQDVGKAVAAKVLSRFPNLNNVLNPFIYVCREAEFRKALKLMYAPLFLKCSPSKKPNSAEEEIEQNAFL